jgi:hypothetical protein
MHVKRCHSIFLPQKNLYSEITVVNKIKTNTDKKISTWSQD